MKKFEISKINGYSVINDFLRNIWVVFLAAFIGFFGSLTYFSHIYTNRYISKMTVSVNLSGYTTDATALSLARTVEISKILDDVFQSDAMKVIVQKEMNGPIGQISAVQLGETNMISISAADTSPEKAYQTLKLVCDNYPKLMDNVFSNVIIRVVENPFMPTAPYNAVSPMVAGVIVGVLAAVAMTFLIVVISYMRDTVKNISDVESELDTKLFATVNRVKTINRHLPKEKRNLSIINPLVGYDFTESFRRIAVKLESLKRTRSIKSVMITSVAENEGKTSISVNTAIALAQNGNKVLLVDCDLKKPAVYHFFDKVENNTENDFIQYISHGGELENYIKHDPDTDVYIMSGLKATSNSSEKVGGTHFKKTMRELKKQFDFIVIDTPPCGLTIDAEVISNVADAVLLVVRQDYVRVSDINENISSFENSYLAGCVFNDVVTFGEKHEKHGIEYSGYYYHEKNNVETE